MNLSIIVPFYNEEKNVPLVLDEFWKLSKKHNFELVCVNDGSKDRTSVIFNKLLKQKKYSFVKFVDNKVNGGYGHAIMTGVKKATGEAICWTHSDMQTPPKDVFRAYDLFRKFDDIKIIVKGYRVGRRMGQEVFSVGMGFISSLILGKWFYEVNAQPKMFHKSFVKHLTNPPTDFSLDLYLLYLAKKHGYKIKSINVRFRPRKHGVSSWAGTAKSRWKTVVRTVKYITKLKRQVG